MSVEGDKKLYEHYKSRAGGSLKSGNSVRDQLIVSDARRHLADLIKKRGNIFEVKKVKEEVKEEIKEDVIESKPKVKN